MEKNYVDVTQSVVRLQMCQETRRRVLKKQTVYTENSKKGPFCLIGLLPRNTISFFIVLLSSEV